MCRSTFAPRYIDVGGSHVSCAACNIIEKKYLPETFSENDLDNQGSVEEIIGVIVSIEKNEK